MTSFLKKYNIELKTVGPVFIGSGKETNKKGLKEVKVYTNVKV